MFFADVLSAFQCAPNTLHLVCPPNHNIHLLQGVYGQYNSSCDQFSGSSRSCCPVNPMLDCMEVISSNTPHDWRELERKCQGQGRCEFDAQLAHMQSCPTHAQYMRVTFHCLSGFLTSHSLYSYFKNLIFYKWNSIDFYSSCKWPFWMQIECWTACNIFLKKYKCTLFWYLDLSYDAATKEKC